MTLRRLSIALALASATALPLFAQAVPRSVSTTGVQDNLPTYNDAEATVISTRLYRALFARDVDPSGLAGTVAAIKAGELRRHVDTMVNSQEFNDHMLSRTPEQMLEQIYQGLLGRSVDPAGTSGFLTNMLQRRYTDTVITIITSPEFKAQLAQAAPTANAGPIGGVAVGASIECQERVVEVIRDELTGFVLLQFDQPTSSGSAITGTATDVSDGGRRLSYRCATPTSVSFSYDDGRRARSAPREGEFANDIVRSCQGEIRSKVIADRKADDVVFESAGLMPDATDTQAVRGLGFERSSSGKNGANFTYSCDMRGTQILVSSFRMR